MSRPKKRRGIQPTDSDRQGQFSRRALLLGGGQAMLFGALAGRLYYLQVIEGDRYALLAEENRINVQLIQPRRGRIVDRFGVTLADNEQSYRVLLTAEQAADVDAVLAEVARIVGLNDDDLDRVRDDVRRQKNFVPVAVAEYLQWEDVAQIEVRRPDLPGISIDVGDRRFYPEANAAAHVLGYVARVSAEDLTGDPLLETPGFRIGRTGVEREFDRSLRGRAGARQLEVNANGRVVRELGRRSADKGGDLVLTLDMAVQRYAAERLGDQAGAIVVMDANTGDIAALASTPSFDPNSFANGLGADEWAALSENIRAPLRNKAIAGEFAPGSTFKMAVALAALEEGVSHSGTEVNCPGHIDLGNSRFHCWRRGGHGKLDLTEAIAQSCDVYFYELAQRLGIDRIAAMARRLGLGEDFDIEIPGARSGLVPTAAWKRAVIGEAWVGGETLITGIGQGFLLATPLQMAVMTARIANGGRAVVPRLTAAQGVRLPDRLPEPDPHAPADILARAEVPVSLTVGEAASTEDLGFDPRHVAAVRRGMSAVIASPRGTAYAARIGDPGIEMAGKTGTAQVRRISIAEREGGVLRNEDLIWRQRDHALFVGYGPVEEPKYAISVVVQHGGGGSAVAAPIARDVLALALRRDRARATAAATPDRRPGVTEGMADDIAEDLDLETSPGRQPGGHHLSGREG
jgi:penicillin-binding protein 2